MNIAQILYDMRNDQRPASDFVSFVEDLLQKVDSQP